MVAVFPLTVISRFVTTCRRLRAIVESMGIEGLADLVRPFCFAPESRENSVGNESGHKTRFVFRVQGVIELSAELGDLDSICRNRIARLLGLSRCRQSRCRGHSQNQKYECQKSFRCHDALPFRSSSLRFCDCSLLVRATLSSQRGGRIGSCANCLHSMEVHSLVLFWRPLRSSLNFWWMRAWSFYG